MDVKDATLLPGDVLCVSTGTFWGRFIELGSWLEHTGGRCDHVVVVHHADLAGNLWGIEGRPGGVGWIELLRCDYRLVSSNIGQPKTPEQRASIALIAKGLIGTPYDWPAIVVDAMQAIDAQKLWNTRQWGPQTPGHVVCSSLADWAYEHAGLASPVNDRWVTPGDWDRFNVSKGWQL